MNFLKKIEIVNKLVFHLIILQFIMIYFINNAPPIVLMNNINSVVVGAFFLLNNITHYYNRNAAIYSIPFVVLVSFLSTDDFLKFYGSILCFQSMLINWVFFDYFFSKNKENNHQYFYKNKYFWSAAVGSNFMSASIDSISFSFIAEAELPSFNQLESIICLMIIFLFFAIKLKNDKTYLSLFSVFFAACLFVFMWFKANSAWVDPFAYKLASVLCGCSPDNQLAWIVDIASTSLFKVIIPTSAWWILSFYNKKNIGVSYG